MNDGQKICPPSPDTTPPVVSIIAPAGGSTVSGVTMVTADASDNVAVVGVQFFLDGAVLQRGFQEAEG